MNHYGLGWAFKNGLVSMSSVSALYTKYQNCISVLVSISIRYVSWKLSIGKLIVIHKSDDTEGNCKAGRL